VLDSLSAVEPVRARLGTIRSVVDIGSGGGYPGIPVGLALGAGRISLVESVGRKARFLEAAGNAARAALEAEDPPVIEVLPVRAESLASDQHRGTWDVDTVRGRREPRECAELGLPLLRTGGSCVLEAPAPSHRLSVAHRDDVGAEVDRGRPLWVSSAGVHRCAGGGVPGAPGHRLVLVPKERPTPDRFPRPPAARRTTDERCRGRRA